MPTQPKKPKLVEAFDKTSHGRNAEQQTGYEKVDDVRVLERYFHPILWQPFESNVTTQQVTVTLYDFKSFTATVTSMTLDKKMNLQGEVTSTIVPFSHFENKEAVREAHRVLQELGGTPPPLGDFNMATTRDIVAPERAQFKPKP